MLAFFEQSLKNSLLTRPQSVFNIRCVDEAGYVDLGNQLKSYGLAYHHLPINYHEPRVRTSSLIICAIMYHQSRVFECPRVFARLLHPMTLFIDAAGERC